MSNVVTAGRRGHKLTFFSLELLECSLPQPEGITKHSKNENTAASALPSRKEGKFATQSPRSRTDHGQRPGTHAARSRGQRGCSHKARTHGSSVCQNQMNKNTGEANACRIQSPSKSS